MTKYNLDMILVVDIEASCWSDREVPQGQQTEIIEIGICCLDVRRGRISRDSLLCKPRRSKISNFCTQLTGHTQEDFDHVPEFPAQCGILKDKYKSRTRSWSSWGLYDRFMLDRQLRRDNVEHPMSGNHINTKNLFSLWRGMSNEVGLMDALRIMHWSFEGTPHSGRDDAWNAARLLSAILWGSESR